jgi:tetratricopeptide (TPR) repeat protein
MEAYDAFLRGRYHWHQQTEAGFRQASELFEQAIALDPAFGKAFAWLAIVRTYATLFGYSPPAQALPAAREEAKRAIALDASLTEAHLALGLVAQYADWDWAATEDHYRRAVELSPGDATARAWFGLFLVRLGRGEEAVAQSAAALDLDPLAHESSWLYLIVLTHLGRHSEAVALGHKAASVHPRSPHLHWPTGMAHLGLGEADLAVECVEKALECEPGNPYARAYEVRALAAAGRTGEALQRLTVLEDEKQRGYFSPFILAIAELAVSEHDRAIDLLREALEAGDAMIPYINHWGMSALADDPRYEAMLEAVNLPNLFGRDRAGSPATAR